jgi:hypothetical protein
MKKWVRTNPTDFTNEKLRKVFEDFLDYLRTLDDEKGAQYARFLTQSLEGALQEQVRCARRYFMPSMRDLNIGTRSFTSIKAFKLVSLVEKTASTCVNLNTCDICGTCARSIIGPFELAIS